MKMNINDLHDQFCQESYLIKNNSEATIKWFKVTFGLFMKRWPDIRHVEEVTTEKLRMWLYDGRLKRNWTTDTFINYHNFENRIINVNHGKGGKDRIVPMSAKLHRYLKEYFEDRERLKKVGEFE